MPAPVIYRSSYPTPHVPCDVSVSQFLLQSNPDDVAPDKEILSDFDNPEQAITLGRLRYHASRDASFLRHRFGLQDQDVVCIYAANSVYWASLAHAVLWARACFCGINSMATSYELAHYLAVAKPKLLAVDDELVPRVLAALQNLGLDDRPRLVVIGGNNTGSAASTVRFPQDFRSPGHDPIPPFDLSTRDNRNVPAGMCFSSGTSGKPKGVVFSHHNLIAQLLTVRATNPFTHNAYMREAFFPSFAHIYGIVSGVLLPAWIGNYVQVMKKFEYLPYLQRCSELRATVLRLVPAAAVRMVKDPDVRKLDLSAVHTIMCSGAPLSDEIVKGLQAILRPDTQVLNGYGMSETTVTLLRNTRNGTKGASVGKPAAGVSLRIVDDNFEDVPAETDGECLVRGPTVFMEYKNNPEETAAAFSDGWLRTGDVVRVDGDGFFWLTGRKKELIKYKGNQIAPAELEAVLLSHPLVTDAGVCGIRDRIAGEEVPVGFICMASFGGARDDESQKTIDEIIDEINAFVNERVAPYKRLRGGLYLIDVLPKNNSGKLVRRELTEIALGRHRTGAKL